MENYIITISRRFASKGHEIAGLAGSMLGIPVYDRSSVEARLQSLGIAAGKPALQGDIPGEGPDRPRPDNMSRGLLMGLFRGRTREQIPDEAQMEFERQSEVIRSLVAEGSCIILGRCADQIFENYGRALHVFIYASDRERIANTMKMLHTGEDEARALVKNEDRAREQYRRRFSSHPEDEVAGRHILLDSGKLGVEMCANILVHTAGYLFGEEKG